MISWVKCWVWVKGSYRYCVSACDKRMGERLCVSLVDLKVGFVKVV